jgi:hypothetical protein
MDIEPSTLEKGMEDWVVDETAKRGCQDDMRGIRLSTLMSVKRFRSLGVG